MQVVSQGNNAVSNLDISRKGSYIYTNISWLKIHPSKTHKYLLTWEKADLLLPSHDAADLSN